jgi:hypothetical protein
VFPEEALEYLARLREALCRAHEVGVAEDDEFAAGAAECDVDQSPAAGLMKEPARNTEGWTVYQVQNNGIGLGALHTVHRADG